MKNAGKRSFSIAGAAVGLVVAVLLALYLLYDSKLSGAEFVAFVFAFAVLCVAVGFAPEIQEVSIAGNVVKLREVKAEAIKTIESLKRSRVESHRALLKLALNVSGAFANEHPIDPRNSEFCRLVDLAREYDCLIELKPEILTGLDALLAAQTHVIHLRNQNVARGRIISPVELAHIALDSLGIEGTTLRRHAGLSVSSARAEVIEALEEYSRLYELKRNIEALS
ncbi:hypothetical protein [Pseudomonas piscis]|uniref:hypothetical protein n=1 Tax=Pseudomonas piscis TaxID=2614538 RepID=UPI0021D5CC7E|nr:hypothetical protein [Pseudomonas piscis]MCU7645606.1 hypothetical protein [Pseudomonas piscis]